MSLGEYRDQIDQIDNQLLDLFQQRMDVVKNVAQFKIDNDMQVLHPEREQQVLDKKAAQARPEYSDYVRELYVEMMKLSRHMQEGLIEENKK